MGKPKPTVSLPLHLLEQAWKLKAGSCMGCQGSVRRLEAPIRGRNASKVQTHPGKNAPLLSGAEIIMIRGPRGAAKPSKLVRLSHARKFVQACAA